MRIPIRALVDNLLFTTGGTVWAVYRMTGTASQFATLREREESLGRLTSLVRSLAGAPRLYGLCAQIDPGEVAARMVQGIDTNRHPGCAEVADASLDLMDGAEMHRRTHWLAVPLASSNPRTEALAAVASGWTELADQLGLRTAPVSAAQLAQYRQRAQQITAQLSGGPALRAATAAEVVWMVEHVIHRGLEEPLLTAAEQSGLRSARLRNGELRAPSYRQLGQVRLLEGGRPAEGSRSEERGPWWRRSTGASPLLRRWLQVETAEKGTGYQAHLVIGELPAAVSWPGGDVLAQLEGFPFAVDYVLDLKVVTAEKATPSIRRKKRELIDQAEQYGAETSGLPDSLHQAAADLGELGVRLGRTSSEVEVQSVTTLSVWGESPDLCDQRARTVASVLGGQDYQVIRPVGGQEALFTLGIPGSALSPALNEYRQYQLSEDWAMLGAGTSIEVGDATGALLGFSLDAGTAHPILLDLPRAPQGNSSGSMGVIGELGAGKSVAEKALTSGVVDRGGRAIVVDRTPRREWAAYALSAHPDCQIIDASAARLSIDPLRIFPGPDGARWAISYLTLQLGIGPMSPGGTALDFAVKRAAASANPSMAQVLAELEQRAAEEGRRGQDAAAVADLLQIVAHHPLGAMVFDPDLPPLDLERLTGDMVVFTTSGLTLPPQQACADAELLRQQPLEALIGRAVLYLVAAVARQVAFTDHSRYSLVVMDECYWITSSSEGLALVHEVVHDGRKHNAGVLLGTHDAEEIGDEAIRGLLSYKLLMRHSDPVLAARGLEFLGLDGSDPELVRAVTSLSPTGDRDRAGEGMLRDCQRRIGRIRVMIPPVARIEAQISTTPGQHAVPIVAELLTGEGRHALATGDGGGSSAPSLPARSQAPLVKAGPR